MNETENTIVSNEIETGTEISETFFNKLVGISEASAITGRSKGQIGRDSNTKRLAHVLDEKQQKRYKVADLYQLYGFKRPKETMPQEAERPQEITAETAIEIAVLRAEMKAKDEALRRMEDENRDLRQTRDRLLETTSRLTLLLPSPPSNTPEPVSNSTERKSLWKRLFA